MSEFDSRGEEYSDIDVDAKVYRRIVDRACATNAFFDKIAIDGLPKLVATAIKDKVTKMRLKRWKMRRRKKEKDLIDKHIEMDMVRDMEKEKDEETEKDESSDTNNSDDSGADGGRGGGRRG